jgi:predicted phage terminase large subunit-like protein
VRAVPIPLLDFIPALSPKWSSPRHLAPLASSFERASREPTFTFGTTPPRHGKTELIKHAIVWRLLTDPTKRIAYGSYSARAAFKRSREIRALYQRAGGYVDPKASSVADWRTGCETGGLWAAGAGGSWTGEGFDWLVLDDPIKGRKEAESATKSETLWDWYSADFETRVEPGGSISVIHTRWTTNDLGGSLLAGKGVQTYEHVHLPAIDAHGRALWPERWTIEALRQIERKKGAYDWQSLYMGRPFNRGGRVFHAERYYDVRPARLRIAVGCDLAYSKKTSSDWSAIVVLGIDDTTGRIYVLDVVRLQVSAPTFALRLRAVLKQWGATEARWYYAGAELGIADFINTLDEAIEALPASSDKFVRAQPCAAAWNDEVDGKPGPGRIFVPRSAPWLPDFLAELSAFTGVEDARDDQVDAFDAAFDALEQPGWVHAMENWRKSGGVGFGT